MSESQTVLNFIDVLSDLFYDWVVYSQEQSLIKNSDGSYEINKTCIYLEDNEYFLSYKMDLSEVSKEAYDKLNQFYDLYDKDPGFQQFCNWIHFYWHKMNKLEMKNGEFKIDEIKVSPRGKKFYMTSQSNVVEITKETYNKIIKFYELTK